MALRRRFLCAALFAFGGAAGCLTARCCSEAVCLLAWQRAAGFALDAPVLAALVWNLLFPVCVVFFAGSVAGFLLAPLADLMFGVCYGFVALVCLRHAGTAAAFTLLLLAGLGCVPCLLLSARAVRVSRGLCAAFQSGGKRTFDCAGDAAAMAAALAAVAALSVLEGLLLARWL